MTLETSYGSLEKLADGGRLTFVRELAHPREKVWRAITDPDELAVWFPSTIDGERVSGAPLKFVFPFPDAPVMEGTMLACDPPSTIEFEWGEGDVLRITLEETAGGTRLTLTDTFGELEKAARDAAGWHACLDRMQFQLADAAWPYGDDGRWQEVTPYYQSTFPPEATTAPIPDFHPMAEELNR